MKAPNPTKREPTKPNSPTRTAFQAPDLELTTDEAAAAAELAADFALVAPVVLDVADAAEAEEVEAEEATVEDEAEEDEAEEEEDPVVDAPERV